MLVSKLKEEDINQNVVDKILFEGLEEQKIKGDCIMVLGSKKAAKYRAPKAIELYRAGFADKILLSGGNFIETEQGPLKEAKMMQTFLIEHNIPNEDILMEEVSMTTKENFLCSLVILERTFKLCELHRLLLVTTRYHMRRSLLMAATYLPNWIEVAPCPADDINTQRHNWFLTEKGQERARNEVNTIIHYIREGSIPDFEI